MPSRFTCSGKRFALSTLCFDAKPALVVLGIAGSNTWLEFGRILEESLGVLFNGVPMFGLAQCKGFTPVTLFTVSSTILTCTRICLYINAINLVRIIISGVVTLMESQEEYIIYIYMNYLCSQGFDISS